MSTITIDRATVEQALEALEAGLDVDPILAGEAEEALRAALAQEQAEPVADPFNCPKCGRHDYGLRGSCPTCDAQPKAEPVQEHEDWCASVTQLLLSYPPQKAPCNCKPAQKFKPTPLTKEQMDAPLLRTMVPLTEEEMYAVEEEARKNFRLSQQGSRGQQITYWDGLTPWLIRAVEKASWEKNK